MTVFISGGAKNGKSSLAQKTAVRLADGGALYYIATMIPADEEDRERIRRHVADRQGLGFCTVECGRDLLSCLDGVDREGTFLIDSTTALLANEMFHDGKIDELAASRCIEQIVRFADTVKNAVFVSDGICCDAERYDGITELYRRGLTHMDRALSKICDTVIEMAAGQAVVYKGELVR